MLPYLLVMSELIVVLGFSGSSMPTMMSACVFVVGKRSRAVSRAEFFRFFRWFNMLVLSSGGSVLSDY